ncbi:aminomethyl-transferring glycine dehydrogenase subunit GcvPA [Fervidicoccus fontis]|uniref:Aminomethyl-transferring glycine dehydrogenase subunit GcvPA n=1 Tax=Fervidicoccus fontis TaxID=683846 RepID=A0A843ALB3_9CREN|nr:aminomethyl-transferring glycine dehydrogenase subunit GcvPA [Fervidicoccus fontis]MBE9391701.1 aminomethyl-transferring glycine dehydrogenase subunit GcvPA [Fervidicoccus fontis]
MKYHPWIPNDNEELLNIMLKTISINNWDELFTSIPEEIKLKKKLKIGAERPLNTIELEKHMKEVVRAQNIVDLERVFSGGPVAPHFVPQVTTYLINRGEFLTAYTPYQAEISQGLLKALYEYQSLMAILYDIEIVNAGMYDGGTALAEASLLSIRIKKNKKIAISSTLFEEYKSVIKTYLYGQNATLIEYDFDKDTGEITGETIEKIKNEKPSGVIIDYPSNFGPIRKSTKELIEEVHKYGSLAITFSDPSSLPILTPPGELGSDIIVGEGQSLGLPMSGGGSLLGILGIKNDKELLRNLPGRLIGETVDADGKKGYMMILQTREQHIRREKATSNITTATTLNAIAVAINVLLYGEKGLKTRAEKILENTKMLKQALEKNGIEASYKKALHFKNISYKIDDPFTEGREIIEKYKIIPFTPYQNYAISSATEVHNNEDISLFSEAIGGVLRK